MVALCGWRGRVGGLGGVSVVLRGMMWCDAGDGDGDRDGDRKGCNVARK